MRATRQSSLWIVLALAAGLVLVGIFLRRQHVKPVTISGAITVKDSDPRKQLPIAGVEVTVADNSGVDPVKSDSSGFFSLKLRNGLRRGQAMTLKFRHPDYHPLDLPEFAGDKLYVIQLSSLSSNPETPNHPPVVVANVRVRYSIKALRTVNVGSAAKTFQVENVGNIPCKGRSPCSPDGKWKATTASVSLDAGPGNEFQNARVSCIAGPCPFSRTESDRFPQSSQTITASALGWSDPVTFLVEAEVVHTMQSPIEHESYPVIFGSALSFT